jgi:hypothetical protein
MSRCNKIQVGKCWSAGEPESPASAARPHPPHEVLAERVQEDWFNGGQPQQDDAEDRTMTDDGEPGPVVADNHSAAEAGDDVCGRSGWGCDQPLVLPDISTARTETRSSSSGGGRRTCADGADGASEGPTPHAPRHQHSEARDSEQHNKDDWFTEGRP